MMREVREKKWSELAQVWQELCNNNPTATPFQSYEFLTYTKRGKAQWREPLRLFGVREWNLLLYSDGRPVAIAPLQIKRSHGVVTVVLRGHFTVASHLDFIYSSWSFDDFRFLMDYIRQRLGRVSFVLDRVSERTVTCGYLKRYFAGNSMEEHECFSIHVPASHDDWLNGLNRSVKRNLIGYHNRMKRDNLAWSVDFYCEQPIGKKLCRRLMRVYAGRFLEKNSLRFGAFRGIVARLLQMFLIRDRMTRWMNRGEGSLHAVLNVNEEVAAFTSGIICRDKRIILSRFAINTDYSRYGPGGVLLNALVRHVTEQNRSGAMDIRELDLSQGGQGGMSYKQAYGGKLHYNYVFYG